eukprot:TRINITY_DN11301_c0_g4_i9.p1 TRINITY_DN11301_c0_g4~~TRINITY_DN11301_c0_g4_i9.p1  ORF type:complete len:135 (-),score=29.31 TRINITY_DN11301_c0_g4_i9:98-502(-)
MRLCGSSSFEVLEEMPWEKMEDVELPAMKDVACTEFTGSTADSVEVPNQLPKRNKTLDDQLEFIMETCQKHQSGKEKAHKRNRKTPEQIKILIEELGEVPRKVGKKEIRKAADKAGLTELQVYKWHYDRKCRLG